MDFGITNNHIENELKSHDSEQVSSEVSQRKDTEYYLKYFSEKMETYEENINTTYLNIKKVLNQLEEEFPEIDITNFSDFLLICEEYYNLFQDAQEILAKAQETHSQNESLKQKLEKKNGKKIILKASLKNLKDEIKFRDFQIQKLEEELSMNNKEYIDLLSKYSQTQNKDNELTPKGIKKIESMISQKFYNGEILHIKEENQNLQKENSYLTRNLEILQNEIKAKYIPKIETEKKIAQLESESNYYMSKLKISEAFCDKLKRQLHNLSLDNDELKKELQESARRIDNIYDSELANKGTPLNLLSGDSEEGNEEEDGNKRKLTFSKLRRDNSNISRFTMNDNENVPILEGNRETEKENEQKRGNNPVFKIYDQNFVIPEVEGEDKNSNRSFEALAYNTLLTNIELNNSQVSDDKKSEKKFSINITASDIVNQMSQNVFNNLKESNQDKISVPVIAQEKKKTAIHSEPDVRKLNKQKTESEQRLFKYNKRLSMIVHSTSDRDKDRSNIKGKTLLKSNYKDETFKDFFNLTYQSFKLNSEDIEAFLHLSSDKLYKQSTENCVPFHKFHEFINSEIKKCKEKINSKTNYAKKKYETVKLFLIYINK